MVRNPNQLRRPASFFRSTWFDMDRTTAEALPRIDSTPSTQFISTVEEMSVREAKPVSGSVLVEIAVRALWCQAVGCWRALGWVGRDVFMPSIVFFAA